MHSDTGPGTGFWPGTYIKCNTKVKKFKWEANFLGYNTKRFLHWKGKILLLKNCVNISLDPELELEPEPEPDPEPDQQ
jgi:hypothetical protein